MESADLGDSARRRVPGPGLIAALATLAVGLIGTAPATAAQNLAPDPGGSEDAIVAVPPPDGQAFGFNDLAPLSRGVPAGTLAKITQDAGANIHRLTVNWQEVEPEQDVASDENWAKYEAIGNAFRAHGQRLLITLSPAPPWAREGGLPQLCYVTLTCTYPPAEHMLGEWREYVTQVVRRFPGAVIETWNEPNIVHFWRPYPQPARFARLHAATYAAAKAADPNVTVLAGGVAGTVSSSTQGEMTARRFLNEAYGTGLLKNTVDALSIHLYTNNERPMGKDTLFAQSLHDMRQARNAAGDHNKKIWVTETGLSTSGNWAISAEKQADGLIRRYRRLMTMDDIGGMIIHTALDQVERDRSDRGYGFGLVQGHSPFVVKPAYCEFAGRASQNPPAPCSTIVDKPPPGLTGDPDLDELIKSAPKAVKTKAKSRCKRWSREIASFKRASKKKRGRLRLSCVTKYLAAHGTNRQALNHEVLRAPRKACKQKIKRQSARHRLVRSKRAKLVRTCTGRRSLKALNRLFAEIS